MTEQNGDWLRKILADLRLETPLAGETREPLDEYINLSGSFDWMINGFNYQISRAAGTANDPLLVEALPHLVQDPSVYLILGSRGSGKTALGGRLLEVYEPHVSEKYVVGLPKSSAFLLPKWIKRVDSIFSLPDRAVALIDEAHLNLGPHMAEVDRKELASLLALSRQRRQNLIFISQQARTISREIVAATDVLIVTNVREQQVKFDRPEFTEALLQASDRLSTVFGDRKPYSFVYAPEDGLGHLMKSKLPAFWSEELSRLYAAQIPPRTLSDEAADRRRRRIDVAKQMHRLGFSYGAIAKRLGVSRGTAWNYVNRY